MKPIFKISLVTCLLGFATLSHSAPLSTKLSTGAFYAYGQDNTSGNTDTSITAVPFSINLRKDKFSSTLATSYLNSKYGTTSASGMGDTTLSLGYNLSNEFSLKGKYKFATGDAKKGLSTGKDDFSTQLDYFQPVTLKTSLFATLGYKFTGKVSGKSMQDTAYASLGGGYLPISGLSIGSSLDYRQSTYKNLKDQLGLSLFLDKKLSKHLHTAIFGGYDNTDTASVGLIFSYKL